MNAAATPVMSHQEVVQALRQLRTDGDRIAAALVGLGDHPGRRFLDGTRLTGQTLKRWTAAKTAIDLLWDRFARYRDVLDQAERTKDPAELTMLLRGRSVGLPTENVPLDERGLTGAATVTPRVSLTELVATMTAAYRCPAVHSGSQAADRPSAHRAGRGGQCRQGAGRVQINEFIRRDAGLLRYVLRPGHQGVFMASTELADR